MASRKLFQFIIRGSRPFLYATSSIFVNSAATKKPTSEQKLNLEPPDVKNLSFDYMIKQSTIDAVNSASQALTVTYSAIETTSKEYRCLLMQLISLVQETVANEVCDSHWDAIVEVRSEVQSMKQTISQLVGFMDYVHKMAEATSETTFLAGMENLSSTLCQRINDAVSQMNKEIENNKELEDEYCRIQQQCIIKSGKEDIFEVEGKESPISYPEKNIKAVSS